MKDEGSKHSVEDGLRSLRAERDEPAPSIWSSSTFSHLGCVSQRHGDVVVAEVHGDFAQDDENRDWNHGRQDLEEGTTKDVESGRPGALPCLIHKALLPAALILHKDHRS